MGICFTADGRLVVGDVGQLCCDDGGVVAFDSSANPTVLASAATSDLYNPLDVIQDPTRMLGGDLLVTDEETGRIYRLNSSGELSVMGGNFRFWNSLSGLEVANGQLFFDDVQDFHVVSAVGPCYILRETCSGNACGTDPRTVDIDDLVAVITHWGPCVPCSEDVAPSYSGDGQVNIDDLVEVITHWGSCP